MKDHIWILQRYGRTEGVITCSFKGAYSTEGKARKGALRMIHTLCGKDWEEDWKNHWKGFLRGQTTFVKGSAHAAKTTLVVGKKVVDPSWYARG